MCENMPPSLTGKCPNYKYNSSSPYGTTHKYSKAVLFSSLSQHTCITILKILQF